jgi:hypothetical protein
VDDQPVFIPTEIEDDAVVTYEIDGSPELPLDLGWGGPMRFGRNCKPGPDRPQNPDDTPRIPAVSDGRSPA